ncbi:MAG: BTAD domain-containing putative transcriptional regulator [Egibacteraceae bacterium]
MRTVRTTRAHQLLMRAHVRAGNPAEALRVYDRCRTSAQRLTALGERERRFAHQDAEGDHGRR